MVPISGTKARQVQSHAQELVARLMGYDDWSELVRITRDAPKRGVPDQMLPPKIAKAHKNAQATLLADEFNIDV